MPDPFEILGVEPRYDLDIQRVEQRYRELSRALHPDRYSGRPASERRVALSRAIEVNAAWRSVRDPVKRAEALLQRLGIPTGEGSEPPADPEFLMEIMELRETLSEIRKSGDARALDELRARVREHELRTHEELGRALGASASAGAVGGATSSASAGAVGGVGGATAPEPPGAIVGLLGKLRYYRRFFDEADAVADEMD